jgi:hypothetical protein
MMGAGIVGVSRPPLVAVLLWVVLLTDDVALEDSNASSTRTISSDREVGTRDEKGSLGESNILSATT